MDEGLNLSAKEIASIGSDLIDHLRVELRDTAGRMDWTKRNLDALRAFKPKRFKVVCSPSGGTADEVDGSRGEFLTLDFIADVEHKGILIAAESEWHNTPARRIVEDFEKLIYIRSPIKVMLCRVNNTVSSGDVIRSIFDSMKTICAEFSPGELYIVYCRKWSNGDSTNGDEVFCLQVGGEPANGSIKSKAFERV